MFPMALFGRGHEYLGSSVVRWMLQGNHKGWSDQRVSRCSAARQMMVRFVTDTNRHQQTAAVFFAFDFWDNRQQFFLEHVLGGLGQWLVSTKKYKENKLHCLEHSPSRNVNARAVYNTMRRICKRLALGPVKVGSPVPCSCTDCLKKILW